jgi:hypothetical protein
LFGLLKRGDSKLFTLDSGPIVLDVDEGSKNVPVLNCILGFLEAITGQRTEFLDGADLVMGHNSTDILPGILTMTKTMGLGRDIQKKLRSFIDVDGRRATMLHGLADMNFGVLRKDEVAAESGDSFGTRNIDFHVVR